MGNFMHNTNIIHQMNHIHPMRYAVIGDRDCVRNNKDIVLNNLPHIYRDVPAGIYEINFNYDYLTRYYIDVYNPCNTGGQRIVVNNKNNILYRTLSNQFPLHIYKELCDEPISYIGNSLEAELDLIAITGKSNHISGSISYPSEPRGIDSFTIKSSNSAVEVIQPLDIHKDIRSLPNGTKDIFVADSLNQRAYILHYVGKQLISGEDESIIKVDTFSTNEYSVFFISNPQAKFLDDKNALVCSHFRPVSYSTLIDKDYRDNAIALSYDYMWRHEGFYIKIDTMTANTLQDFKQLLNNMYKNNPLIIEYPLISHHYEPILLDEYHVKTFFGGTTIECLEGYDLTYFYKSIPY